MGCGTAKVLEDNKEKKQTNNPSNINYFEESNEKKEKKTNETNKSFSFLGINIGALKTVYSIFSEINGKYVSNVLLMNNSSILFKTKP